MVGKIDFLYVKSPVLTLVYDYVGSVLLENKKRFLSW